MHNCHSDLCENMRKEEGTSAKLASSRLPYGKKEEGEEKGEGVVMDFTAA